MDGRDWVLWDGECGFCGRIVSWSKSRDVGGEFSFVPYQEAPTPPMDARLAIACEQAVHVVQRDGRRLRAGRACLFVLGRLGWPRVTAWLARPPLIWLVELAYWIVARNRRLFSRWFFRHEATWEPRSKPGDDRRTR
jgi:predicted DCC family thiol-disulfide oxidoreductase YuxK